MPRTWLVVLASGLAGGCFPSFDGLTGAPNRCEPIEICSEGGVQESGPEGSFDAPPEAPAETSADVPAPLDGPPTAEDVVAAADLVGWFRFEDPMDPGRDSSRLASPSLPATSVVVMMDHVHGGVAAFNGAANQHFHTVARKDMTLTLWLKTITMGQGTDIDPWYAGSSLLEADQGGMVADFGLALVATHVVFGTGNPDQSLRSLTNFTDGQWHHIAATRADTSGSLQVFVDGALEAQGSGAPGERTDATPIMRMGDRILVAQIADVRVYKRVLLADEIAKVIQGR